MTTRLRSVVLLFSLTLTAAVVISSLTVIEILDRVDVLEARANTLSGQVMDLSANKADAGTMNLLVSQEDFRLVYRQVNEVADVVIKGLEQLYALALAVELDKRFVDEENKELRAELADLQEQVDEMEMMIDFVRDECAAKCGGEDGKKSGALDGPPRD